MVVDSDKEHITNEGIETQNNEKITPQVLSSNAGSSLGKKRKNSSSGYIESIELIDFMCHSHLLVRLNAHINFIVGNNGSGKSAILTALTVALGGRASITQRASSMESLIREGATTGIVRIKLFNGGSNPFRAEDYGEHIAIERVFSRGGVNYYHLCSATGRRIADKREELDAICEHFDIQVDNPLTVLTQETAKRFLASARPKDLYQVPKTQIDTLKRDVLVFQKGNSH